MISCILSSWLSISKKVLIWDRLKFSLYPIVTNSSKALSNSKALRKISFSSKLLQMLVVTWANK